MLIVKQYNYRKAEVDLRESSHFRNVQYEEGGVE